MKVDSRPVIVIALSSSRHNDCILAHGTLFWKFNGDYTRTASQWNWKRMKFHSARYAPGVTATWIQSTVLNRPLFSTELICHLFHSPTVPFIAFLQENDLPCIYIFHSDIIIVISVRSTMTCRTMQMRKTNDQANKLKIEWKKQKTGMEVETCGMVAA